MRTAPIRHIKIIAKLQSLLFCLLAFAVTSVALAAEPFYASGKVVDTSGSPVRGIKVYAVLAISNEGVPKVITPLVKGSAVTDKDGEFTFAPLPAPNSGDEYHLIAFSPGKYLGWKRAPDFPGRGSAIVVSIPANYSEKVTDANGAGVAGATVVPRVLTRKLSPGSQTMAAEIICCLVKYKPALTGADGTFTLSGVPEGVEVKVTVTKPGFAQDRGTNAEKEAHGITMVSEAKITGRLVDEKGKAVSGLKVVARGCAHSAWGVAESGPDGAYTIFGLSPGDYKLSLFQSEDKVAPYAERVRVASGQTGRAADMVVTDGVIVSGRVFDAKTGEAITNVKLNAWHQGIARTGTPYGLRLRLDKNGRYRVRIVPGDFTIQYLGGNPNYAMSNDAWLYVKVPQKGKTDANFKMQHAEIATGRVVDPSGKPLAHATIQVLGESRDLNKGRTEEDGYFEIPIAPAPKGECGPGG